MIESYQSDSLTFVLFPFFLCVLSFLKWSTNTSVESFQKLIGWPSKPFSNHNSQLHQLIINNNNLFLFTNKIKMELYPPVCPSRAAPKLAHPLSTPHSELNKSNPQNQWLILVRKEKSHIYINTIQLHIYMSTKLNTMFWGV